MSYSTILMFSKCLKRMLHKEIFETIKKLSSKIFSFNDIIFHQYYFLSIFDVFLNGLVIFQLVEDSYS